jgi:glucan phosphoethanolaminetransferase (alkaline phosphatase superfamily)
MLIYGKEKKIILTHIFIFYKRAFPVFVFAAYNQKRQAFFSNCCLFLLLFAFLWVKTTKSFAVFLLLFFFLLLYHTCVVCTFYNPRFSLPQIGDEFVQVYVRGNVDYLKEIIKKIYPFFLSPPPYII